MTTPRKEEIVRKAVELWKQDQYRNGCSELVELNPEISELAESGYLSLAQSELMQDERKKYAEWLHNETLELKPFNIDIAEAMQTTCFISGSRGSGKSDIAMYIADELMKHDIIVIVFDASTDWLKRNSIGCYMIVQHYSDLPIPEQSIIFDISRLTPIQQQQCVEKFCKKLFEYQIEDQLNKFFIVFEESQLFFPLNALRSKRTQHSMRLLTVGRNIGVSCCVISQFPSLVDKELIKHAEQIWLGLVCELNTLSYWNGILGKYTETLKGLQNGQFVYYHRNKISLTEIEPYKKNNPKIEIKTHIEPISEKRETKSNDLRAITSLCCFLLWFIAVIIGLTQI